MELKRRTTRLLHDEHRAASALLERLDGLLERQPPDHAPDCAEPGVKRLLGDLASHLEGTIRRHFDFEEEHLFQLVRDAGAGAMADLLDEEHVVIRPLLQRVGSLAGAARDGGFGAEDWVRFHDLGLELVERLKAHIEKEEMGLEPLLDDLLEEAADADLAAAHQNGA
jgi:hemerythrin-like domain-containing protein